MDDRIKTIEFTSSEYAFAVNVASIRLASKLTDGKFIAEGLTPFSIHLSGVIGELAVKKLTKGRFDQTIRPHGDKHAPDIIARDGTRMEAKAVNWQGPNPILKLYRNELHEGINEYVMTRVRGFVLCDVYPGIPLKILLDNSYMRDFNYGQRLCVNEWVFLEHGHVYPREKE